MSNRSNGFPPACTTIVHGSSIYTWDPRGYHWVLVGPHTPLPASDPSRSVPSHAGIQLAPEGVTLPLHTLGQSAAGMQQLYAARNTTITAHSAPPSALNTANNVPTIIPPPGMVQVGLASVASRFRSAMPLVDMGSSPVSASHTASMIVAPHPQRAVFQPPLQQPNWQPVPQYIAVGQDGYARGQQLTDADVRLPPVSFFPGFILGDAFRGDLQGSRDLNEPAWPEELYQTAQKLGIVFCFPDYEVYTHQVNVHRARGKPLRRQRLAQIVAVELQRFLKKACEEDNKPLRCPQSGRVLTLQDLVLLEVVQVSRGSLQPVLAVRPP